MGQLDHKLTGGPEPGEKCMTTGDVRDLLERLYALGDDGDVRIYAKTTVGGKVVRMWATVDARAPLSPAQDWDLLPGARPGELYQEPPAELPADGPLELPGEGPLELPAWAEADAKTGGTITIPAVDAQPPPRAALAGRGGRHKRT
jgi:hypothetical protein